MKNKFITVFQTVFMGVLWVISMPLAAQQNILLSEAEVPATIYQSGVVESTRHVEPWKWHVKSRVDTIFIGGEEKRLVQLKHSSALGFGLPKKWELNLMLPVGHTLSTFSANGNKGTGLGDLRFGVLRVLKEAPQGGIGLILGVLTYFPTGHHEHLLGEGDFSLNSFLAASFSIFSSSLHVNVGYRFRPEHQRTLLSGKRFEQDDNLIWRVGIRIPKDEDIAWSLEMNGTIGVATDAGLWPDRDHRPLWLGGGIDYPTLAQNRLGFFASFLLSGDHRGILLSVQLSGVAKDRDEDRDGILRGEDQCPLLREDMDGFEDHDGCPENDNDLDTFPDKEDACPFKKADEFSDDGC